MGCWLQTGSDKNLNILRSLTHRPFALMWGGQTISRLGDSLYRIGLSWWVLERTGSATAAGAVQFFTLIPLLVFLLIGGVAADRLPRMRVMFVSDILRGVLVGGVALMAALGTLELWHIYVASVMFGFVNAFFQPAYTALVPEITPAELLPSANSLTNLGGTLAGIVGPAIGAVIISFGGTPLAFGLDALSFLGAGLLLLPILSLSTSPKKKKGDEPPRSPFADLREGIRATFSEPWLWITIVFFGFANITLSGPMSIAMPFRIQRDLGEGVSALGLVTSMSSIGAVVASVWLGRYKKLRRRGLIAYGAVLATAAAVFVIGLPVGVPGVAAGAFVFGASVGVFTLVWVNTLQEMVPGDLLGRVSSVDQLGSFILLPLGYALTGVLADKIGPSQVFLLGGAISFVAVLLILLVPSIRNLD